MSNVADISPEAAAQSWDAVRAFVNTVRTTDPDSAPDRVRLLEIAEECVNGLSDKARVHFASALMMKVSDPGAAAAMRFAANQLTVLADTLTREAFEQECG